MSKSKDFGENELPVDGEIGGEYVVTSGCTIRILPDMVSVDAPPHQIGEDFVIEGVCLPTETKIDLGNKHEVKTGFTSFVLIQSMHDDNNDVKSWLDANIRLKLAENSFNSGKKTVIFPQFEQFEGMMDQDTVNKIMRREHLNMKHYNVLDTVRNEVIRLIEMDSCAATVFSLWLIGTYVFDAFDAFPYVWLTGLRGTGKTRALELAELISYHAEMGEKISNPALFRDVHQHHSTILYDEAENLLSYSKEGSVDQDRVSLFNSGYRSSGKVRLVEKVGDVYKTRRFSSYSPKMLASINPIDEALQSRCLIFQMMRAQDERKAEQQMNVELCKKIRSELFMFRFSDGLCFKEANISTETNELRVKYGLKNRDWELFKPMLILADNFCPKWLDDIKEFIDGQKIIKTIDTQFDTTATILAQLKFQMEKALNEGVDAKLTLDYREFLEALKSEYPELKGIRSKSIGKIIKNTGLMALVGRNSRGMYLKCDPKKVSEQMHKLGLSVDDTVIEDKTLDSFTQKTAEAEAK